MPERVLIVGAGGLGSPVALVLGAAERGLISALGILDPDVVDLSNLHRQLLHDEGDIGRPKVRSAAATLARRAPHLPVTPIQDRLTTANAVDLLRGYQVVVDGSDSVETKFLVNDTAVRLGIPAVIGGVVRFAGQVLTVLPGRTACYRCLFEEPPPSGQVATCQEAGVLGPACGLIGALQAQEVLRLCRGQRPSYAGALLLADLLASRYRRVGLSRRPGCPACGDLSGITRQA